MKGKLEMTSSRAARLAPLSGIAFAVLIILGFGVLGGNTPDTTDPAGKVVAFYHDNYGREVAAAVALAVAALCLIWFASSLRQALPSDFAASSAHAGLLVVVVGLLLQAATHIALAEAGHRELAQPAQTINVFEGFNFLVPITGLFAALVATAAATLKQAAFPRWIGWVAAVLALGILTPLAWVASVLAFLWIAAVAVILFRRPGSGEASRGSGTPLSSDAAHAT
jgi:hypothetical protein